jgi:hypothetical protein
MIRDDVLDTLRRKLQGIESQLLANERSYEQKKEWLYRERAEVHEVIAQCQKDGAMADIIARYITLGLG